MKIIEQFTRGKTGDNRKNEDHIVVTPHFCAVLDGATSFNGLMIDGQPNGRFASHTAGAAIGALDPQVTAREAVTQLTRHFARAIDAAAKKAGVKLDTPESLPATALLMYSRARGEIWRLSDSPFMVDGVENQTELPVIAPWIETRKLMIHALRLDGVTDKEMLDKEPMAETWKVLIPPALAFTNSQSPYAWGVLNGKDVPDRLIEEHPVPGAREIILASDGYPRLFNTLAKTEAHLQDTLAKDPLMVEIHPQVKGKKTGWVSFDDRAYLRFNP